MCFQNDNARIQHQIWNKQIPPAGSLYTFKWHGIYLHLDCRDLCTVLEWYQSFKFVLLCNMLCVWNSFGYDVVLDFTYRDCLLNIGLHVSTGWHLIWNIFFIFLFHQICFKNVFLLQEISFPSVYKHLTSHLVHSVSCIFNLAIQCDPEQKKNPTQNRANDRFIIYVSK